MRIPSAYIADRASGVRRALFTEGRQLRGVERAHITFEIGADRAYWGAETAGKVKA